MLPGRVRMLFNRNFSLLFLANFLSELGDWLFRVSIPIFLYQSTGSALVMSASYAVTYLPYLIVTPVGGVLADRLERRRLLVGGDLGAGLLMALLIVILYLDP